MPCDFAKSFDFTAEEVNECFDGLLEGGPRLVPVEIFEQMRACCLANAADNDTQPAQAAQPYCYTVEQRNGLSQGAMCRTRAECEASELFDPEIDHIIPLYREPPAQAEQPVGVPDGLIGALRYQRRIDEDGQEVGVSRQAVDEAINILESLGAPQPPAQPSADAEDAKLFRTLVRRFGPEYDLSTSSGVPHDILIRLRVECGEEVRHADNSLDYAATIRNVLVAEASIQDDAARAAESGE